MSAGMKVIQVVLKTDPLCPHQVRVEQAGHQAAALFLRREAFREQIHAGGHEPRARLVVVEDGVRLAGWKFGPVDGAAIEVAGIEQRHGAGFGFFAQCVF